MANPFSAVPTPFLVEFDDYACYGNCIWDAMGIVAMRGRDALIKTSCGDCGALMEVRIVAGALQSGEGVAHYESQRLPIDFRVQRDPEQEPIS